MALDVVAPAFAVRGLKIEMADLAADMAEGLTGVLDLGSPCRGVAFACQVAAFEGPPFVERGVRVRVPCGGADRLWVECDGPDAKGEAVHTAWIILEGVGDGGRELTALRAGARVPAARGGEVVALAAYAVGIAEGRVCSSACRRHLAQHLRKFRDT